MDKYLFGIDVGGTTVKCGFFCSDGTLIDKWEIETRRKNCGENVLPDIAETIKDKLAENQVTLKAVEGIGIGVPGPVLNDSIVNRCVNLGWGIVDVRQELSDLLEGMPVVVANDANVAALGEQWLGGGKGYKNVVMITLGTGVGGGVIIGGRILAGSHGSAGEIGHFQMNKNETAS